MKSYNIEYAFARNIDSVKQWNELGMMEAENEKEAVLKELDGVEINDIKNAFANEMRKKGIEMALFKVTDPDDVGNFHIISLMG